MNIGNLDITVTDQAVTLRMRHLVQGHPGCVLSIGEVEDLIGRLQTAVARRPAPTPPIHDEDDGDLIG